MSIHYTIQLEDEEHQPTTRIGHADTLGQAMELAQQLCHHDGAETAAITNQDGERWRYHAGRLEELD